MTAPPSPDLGSFWSRHSTALITIACALALDMGLGEAFSAVEGVGWFRGIYWALATATTVGYGDVYPHTRIGRIIAVIAFLTVIPLFAATFSLFTAGVSTVKIRTHLHHSEQRIKDHVEERLAEHHESIQQAISAGQVQEIAQPSQSSQPPSE